MRIGAALVLIAVGAILRFALVTVVSHGVYLHTIGDILMGVGFLGLILWIIVWAPWAQGRRTAYRQPTAEEDRPYPPTARTPGTYTRDEASYDRDYPR